MTESISFTDIALRNPIACSRPYVVELYPDSGYATLAVVCFDLMGVVDGINSEGLTIALLQHRR